MAGMTLMQIRDVPEEDHRALTAAAKRRHMSLQGYLAALLHDTATYEQNRHALELIETRLHEHGGIELGSASDLIASIKEAHDARGQHLARVAGIAT